MPKLVLDRAGDIAKSALWAAASRVGVPILLALVLTGIPAHLLWAGRVNEDLVLAKRDIVAMRDDVRGIKEAAKDYQRTDTQVQTDLATVKTNVAAILRAIDRIEKQVDNALDRRQ